jgi:hypothetical protein
LGKLKVDGFLLGASWLAFATVKYGLFLICFGFLAALLGIQFSLGYQGRL